KRWEPLTRHGPFPGLFQAAAGPLPHGQPEGRIPGAGQGPALPLGRALGTPRSWDAPGRNARAGDPRAAHRAHVLTEFRCEYRLAEGTASLGGQPPASSGKAFLDHGHPAYADMDRPPR